MITTKFDLKNSYKIEAKLFLTFFSCNIIVKFYIFNDLYRTQAIFARSMVLSFTKYYGIFFFLELKNEEKNAFWTNK